MLQGPPGWHGILRGKLYAAVMTRPGIPGSDGCAGAQYGTDGLTYLPLRKSIAYCAMPRAWFESRRKTVAVVLEMHRDEAIIDRRRQTETERKKPWMEKPMTLD